VNYDVKKIQAETPDGVRQNLTHALKPPNYILKYNSPINSVIQVGFYLLLEGEKEEKKSEIKKETPPPPKLELVPKKPDVPKKRLPVFGLLQKRQETRVALNQGKIDALRNQEISYRNINGKRILTFDYTGCWARGLGMISKAMQLEHQLDREIYRYYDIITGQGDGAIIAAAISVGIDYKTLTDWWINDWRKIHSPGFVSKVARSVVSKFKPYQSGYNAKKATAALRKLFTRSKADLRMKDVLTALQITVMQADMKISVHYSGGNQDMEIYTAVEDSAITKVGYSQRETIKGESVFLGAVEKNDVLSFCLSPDNKNMSITSIGTPVRINPEGAKTLNKEGSGATVKATRTASHFVYDKRVEATIAKLKEADYKIKYLRLECEPIDWIVANDTSDEARIAGINSGSGQIDNLNITGEKNGNERIA